MGVSSSLQFEVVANWEKLPQGIRHGDVSGVAVDSADRVYLLTRFDARVIVYNANGDFIDAWGEEAFKRPHGITLAPDNTVYIADDAGHIIHRFSSSGELIGRIGTGIPAETGFDTSLPNLYARTGTIRGGGPFNMPTKVAVAPSGDVFVSDGYGNCKVHRFSPDGRLLASWGEPGSGPGQFRCPHGVSIHPDGRVIVSDRENDRLQLFTLDGVFLEAWDQVQRPCDVAFDGDGFIYVAELSRDPKERSWMHGVPDAELPGRVTVLDPNGRIMTRWGGGPPCAAGNFSAPHSVAVDSHGDLYVGEVSFTRTRAGLGSSPEDCHSVQKFIRR